MTSPLEDLLTRTSSLRRHLADARAALERDSLFDLAKTRYEVESLCELALRLEPDRRAMAAAALEALDADLALTTQHLQDWRAATHAPQQGDDQP